ncbi:MAG: dockerin type I repeat-containing protein [Planctomycetota bacterium]
MSRVTWTIVGVLFFSSSVTATEFAGYPQPRSVYEAMVNLAADETLRIQKHLSFVEQQLLQRDVSELTAAQKQRRAQCIELLVAYREAGCFPRNLDRPGLTPIFIDDRGTACAVAHLMIQTGAAPVAERVAQTQNLAYVPEIRVAGVVEWAAESGLSLEECALIQPAYGSCPALGGFTCGVQGADVLLSWTLLPQHVGVYVERDGLLLTIVTASEGSTFVDVAPGSGTHTYTVYGDCALASLLTPLSCTIDLQAATQFRRGDCNADGGINLADAIFFLNTLFTTPAPTASCSDACDCNDDGDLNLADAVRLLNGLFAAQPLPGPYPECGSDATSDAVGCALAQVCP